MVRVAAERTIPLHKSELLISNICRCRQRAIETLRKFVDKSGPKHGETSLVFRLRLEDYVERFDKLRLAVLSGPAGIGKTTLLARWHTLARNRGMAAGWMSLHRSG